MPIWLVTAVAEKLEVSLLQWRILQTPQGSRHFVGRETSDYNGRASSATQQFDHVTLRGVTRSGRVYQLVRPSGFAA